MQRCLTGVWILIFSLFAAEAYGKCSGYEDLKPAYCVKVRVLSEPATAVFEDGCTFEYSLLEVTPTEPVRREYPYWHWAYGMEFERFGKHFMRAKEPLCQTMRGKKDYQLKGISSQRCDDNIQMEYEYFKKLKALVGISTPEPRFNFSVDPVTVHFHDKGKIEVSCPEDFLVGAPLPTAGEKIDMEILLKDPKNYHGKTISVNGRIELEFENQTLTAFVCGTKSDIPKEIWLDTSKINLISAGNPNYENVRVSGKFNANKKGHFGMFLGTIEVEKIEILPKSFNACEAMKL